MIMTDLVEDKMWNCNKFKMEIHSATRPCRRRRSQNLGNAWTAPLGIGIWLTIKNTPFHHVSYHAEFGRYRSNGTSAGRKNGLIVSHLSRLFKIIVSDTDRSTT